MLASRCGYSTDYSGPVNDRAVLHIDNCYHLPNLKIISHRCKTNMQSSYRIPRLRRPAGHVRHRDRDRGNRAQARHGRARRAPRQPLPRSGRLGRRHDPDHAVRAGHRGLDRRQGDGPGGCRVRLPRAPRSR
ncbi:MAG: molybdopterin-dependent oxidoreductase [Comamonadaceae bacterium]|nr:molybdopterin-dependent oxidoreductase [Comamonadaceae bacterium]